MYKPPLSSLAPYMYEAWYDTIDYDYAYQWFRSHTPVVGGGCSTVRSGNLIGRNLDWTYSESAEFVVHTDGVVGVANAIPGLTDAFVKSGADDEIYKIVPFMLSDGMNKHGLVVSTLVVPTDKGDNSVVRPLDRSTRMMCTLMLPRYALDNFKTAQGAAYYFSSNVTLYHPKTLQDQHYDQHFVFADALATYCMEFVDGRYVITNISNKPYVTNFHLTGIEFNADGSVNTPASGKASDNKITPNGSGLERYNLINERLHDEEFGLLSELGTMDKLMQDLAYTRAYQSSPSPAVPRWDTEFVGNGLTVDSPTSEFDYIQSEAARIYTNRSRILGDTWQTVHSAVYNVQEKKLRLYAQENFDTHWEVSVMADQTHVQHLRGDTTKNDNFTGSAGELTVNTDSHSLRVHDGVMKGGYGTVNATVIENAYEGMDAPKDLPVGAHVITGDGPLDGGAVQAMPIGSINFFGTATAPDGWLVCDGSAVSRTTYSFLYSVIGNTFGAGDGSTTFNLPDLIGRFAEGSLTPGQKKEAGLPNIEGLLTAGRVFVNTSSVGGLTSTGALGWSGAQASNLSPSTVSSGGKVVSGYDFDASRSNPIYGASNTVQPASTTLLPCIKAFGTYIETAGVTTDNLAADIQGINRRLGGLKVATGDMTFYVRKTGNDSNDGLTEGTACLTLSGAYEKAKVWNFSGYDVTLDVGVGVFEGMTLWPLTGARYIKIKGAGIDQTIFEPASGTTNREGIIYCVGPQFYDVRNITIRNTGVAGWCLGAVELVYLDTTDISMYTTATFGQAIEVHGRSYLATHGALRIGGAYSSYCIASRSNSGIQLSGTIAFSSVSSSTTIVSTTESYVAISSSATITGSATGKRYSVIQCSTIDTAGRGANAIPGSAAGTTGTGGQYI